MEGCVSQPRVYKQPATALLRLPQEKRDTVTGSLSTGVLQVTQARGLNLRPAKGAMAGFHLHERGK